MLRRTSWLPHKMYLFHQQSWSYWTLFCECHVFINLLFLSFLLFSPSWYSVWWYALMQNHLKGKKSKVRKCLVQDLRSNENLAKLHSKQSLKSPASQMLLLSPLDGNGNSCLTKFRNLYHKCKYGKRCTLLVHTSESYSIKNTTTTYVLHDWGKSQLPESYKCEKNELRVLPFQTRNWLLKKHTLKKRCVKTTSFMRVVIYHKCFNYSQQQKSKQSQLPYSTMYCKLRQWPLYIIWWG